MLGKLRFAINEQDVEVNVSGVEGVVNHAGGMHFSDDSEHGVNHGEPLWPSGPTMALKMVDEVMCRGHVLELLRDDDALFIFAAFPAAEVDDLESGDTGIDQLLVVVPFDFKCEGAA